MNTVPVIIVIAIAAYLLVQFLPLLKAKQMQGRRAPELDTLLTPEQREERRLLLYFWSPHCGMCRPMTAVINGLMGERDDVIAIDAAQHVEIARAYQVVGTPTLVLIDNGTVRKVLIGAQSEKTIRALLT